MNRNIALGVVVVLVVVVLAWVGYSRTRPLETTAEDDVVMKFVQQSVLLEGRNLAMVSCRELIEEPVVLDLSVNIKTSKDSIEIADAVVRGALDGGTVSSGLASCVRKAYVGRLRKVYPHEIQQMKLPAGREYELDVAARVEQVRIEGY